MSADYCCVCDVLERIHLTTDTHKVGIHPLTTAWRYWCFGCLSRVSSIVPRCCTFFVWKRECLTRKLWWIPPSPFLQEINWISKVSDHFSECGRLMRHTVQLLQMLQVLAIWPNLKSSSPNIFSLSSKIDDQTIQLLGFFHPVCLSF